MDHVGAVEGAIRERQIENAALMERRCRGEPHTLREISSDLDKFRRQVDAGHGRPLGEGARTRRSAEPRADIEQMHSLGEAALVEQGERGGTATEMQLVDQRQIVDGQRRRVLAELNQRSVDGGCQCTVRIVALQLAVDCLMIAHVLNSR